MIRIILMLTLRAASPSKKSNPAFLSNPLLGFSSSYENKKAKLCFAFLFSGEGGFTRVILTLALQAHIKRACKTTFLSFCRTEVLTRNKRIDSHHPDAHPSGGFAVQKSNPAFLSNPLLGFSSSYENKKAKLCFAFLFSEREGFEPSWE